MSVLWRRSRINHAWSLPVLGDPSPGFLALPSMVGAPSMVGGVTTMGGLVESCWIPNAKYCGYYGLRFTMNIICIVMTIITFTSTMIIIYIIIIIAFTITGTIATTITISFTINIPIAILPGNNDLWWLPFLNTFLARCLRLVLEAVSGVHGADVRRKLGRSSDPWSSSGGWIVVDRCW